MSFWFQEIQSPLNLNQMALISGTLRIGAQTLRSEYYSQQSFYNQLQDNNHHIPRPDSSCSLNSNSSVGREAATLPPIHNKNFQESRYKTEMCRHFEETGDCPHGQQCLFAHGQQELKPFRGRHRKFKTQLCKAFHSDGFCSFGPRCSYIHSKPEPKPMITSIHTIIPENSMSANTEFTIEEMDKLELNVMPVDGDKTKVCRLSVFSKICESSQ